MEAEQVQRSFAGRPDRRRAALLGVSALVSVFAIGIGLANAASTVYTFTGDSGTFPTAGLIADSAGNLYGTTYSGGAAGYGTVFKLQPLTSAGKTTWTETVLHSFTGGDGAFPLGSLVFDRSGNLYGTTQQGGNVSACSFETSEAPLGCGVAFELTPPAPGGTVWTETVLHAFSGPDGAFPPAGVTFDKSGDLYGTTSVCGTSPYGGEVFKLTPPAQGKTVWTETVLHIFNYGDGAYPQAGVTLDAQGDVFGTTLYGGSFYEGAVFELTPPAAGQTVWTESTVHSFIGSDGAYPVAPVQFDTKGDLLGTTEGAFGSADYGGDGTVFQLTPPGNGATKWTATVLHAFAGSDGAFPMGGVILDKSGAVYGTTSSGGLIPYVSEGYGTVFALAPPAKGATAWTLKTLYEFTGKKDGAGPTSGLLLNAAGTELFGTASYKGGDGFGTVFELAK